MSLWQVYWVGMALFASRCGVVHGLVKDMSVSGSSWGKASPEGRLTVVDWNAYDERDNNGPGTYSFGYDIEDPDSGNTQFRQEERLLNGTVTGSYGLLEPDGNVRIVHYIADELGYRVTIENSIRKEENFPRRTGGRKTPPRRGHTSRDKQKPSTEDAEWMSSFSKASDRSEPQPFSGNSVADAEVGTVSPALASAVLAQRTGRRPAVQETRRRPSSAWDSQPRRQPLLTGMQLPAFSGGNQATMRRIADAPIQVDKFPPPEHPSSTRPPTAGWKQRQKPAPAPSPSTLDTKSGSAEQLSRKVDNQPSKQTEQEVLKQEEKQLYQRVLQQQLNQDRELGIQDLFPPALMPQQQELQSQPQPDPQPQQPSDQREQNRKHQKGKQRKKTNYAVPAIPLLIQVMPEESYYEGQGKSDLQPSRDDGRYDKSWVDGGPYGLRATNGFILPPIPLLDKLIYHK